MTPRERYWLDALNCALDDEGLSNAVPADARQRIAESLASSAENQSLAFGEDVIPHPLTAELAAVKRSAEEDRRDAERRHKEALDREREARFQAEVELDRLLEEKRRTA